MRIVMEADDRTGLEQGDKIERTEIVLSELGSEGWVRMEVGGRTYDIDYREFWNAARSVCIAVAA
jgi:hypothetical protein